MTSTEDIFKLLTTNWAQITIVLGAVGWVIKVIVDGRTKRQEIKYSIVQNDRIKEIRNFYITCRHLQHAIETFRYVDYKRIDKAELDKKNQNFNRLNTQFLTEYSSMRILLDKKDLSKIEKFQARFDEIQGLLYGHLMDKAMKDWDAQTWLDETEKMDKILTELPTLILDLEQILRRYVGAD